MMPIKSRQFHNSDKAKCKSKSYSSKDSEEFRQDDLPVFNADDSQLRTGTAPRFDSSICFPINKLMITKLFKSLSFQGYICQIGET